MKSIRKKIAFLINHEIDNAIKDVINETYPLSDNGTKAFPSHEFKKKFEDRNKNINRIRGSIRNTKQ